MELLTFLQVFLLSLSLTDGFNIDINDPYVYNIGKSGYYFGYALALHRNKARNEKWMLVGAPLGNDTARGVKDYWGALYKCDVSSSTGKCEVMKNFDNSELAVKVEGDNTFPKDRKTRQWFGATVLAVADRIMACAPRYVVTGDQARGHYLEGRCELHNLKDPAKNVVWEPCSQAGGRTNDHCEIGLAADLSSDGVDVVSSAVGVLNFKGRVIHTTYTVVNKTSYSSAVNVSSNDYLGYAVAVGPFGPNKELMYAAGAPRAKLVVGKVLMFKQIKPPIGASAELKNPIPQVGSYYGSTLLALDYNGDGFSDLLVGAPYHSWNYNEGAIVAYTNDKTGILTPVEDILVGDKAPGALFGRALAKADLNRDGFEDAVIGAPYEDNGIGAVYLYYGSKDGIRTKYSQKIQPRGLGKGLGASLATFGLGVGAGADVDDNRYPDVAIGSFTRDRAAFLRARPVIKITSEIEVNVEKIILGSNKHLCPTKDGKKQPCIIVKVYFSFVEDTLTSADVQYTLVVDPGQASRRGYFSENNSPEVSKTKSLTKNTRLFDEYTVFLLNNTRDIFIPLTLRLSFKYVELKPCNLCPVQNAFETRTVEKEVPYIKNCGDDDICDADLRISGQAVIPDNQKVIRVGVTDSFQLLVTVENKGENAFSTQMAVTMSKLLGVIGVKQVNGDRIAWKKETLSSQFKLTFKAGNPIRSGQKVQFEINFGVASTITSVKAFDFSLEVTTLSKEIRPKDNVIQMSIPTVIEADMTISGVVVPVQAIYSETVTSLKTPGPTVTHTLLVQNKGPSTVVRSEVEIKFPNRVGNDYFLNLMALTIVGSANCNLDEKYKDPLKLKSGGAQSNSTKTKKRRRRDIQNIDCSGSDYSCLRFTCDIGQLRRRESVVIKLESTVVEKTFNEVFKGSRKITMEAVVRPFKIDQPAHSNSPDKVNLEFTVISPAPVTSKSTSSVPWWVILLSVLAGVILIAGIVFILYKKGFFNRKKHSQVPTQEDEEL